MSISYPVTFPDISPSGLTLRHLTAASISESPYSGHEQVYTYDYQKWALDFSFPPLRRSDASVLTSFLLSLNGRQGTFTYGPSASFPIQGNTYQDGAVNGGSQTGKSIVTDGWPVNMDTILKAGDYVGINGYLYQILTDVDSNSSGQATIDIWPNLRSASDNAVISITSPTTTFRLTSANIEYSIDIAINYGVEFSAMEVL